MSTQDNTIIQVMRSADVLIGGTPEISKHFTGGSYPKLPESDTLEFGEIALNIAKGYEVIAIKNYDGEIVYLPFNVAARLLNAENSLDELRVYSIQSVNELSATTVSLFNDIESFKADVRNSIEEELSSLSGDILTKIEQVSGETNSRIDSLGSDLETQIINLEEYLDLVAESIISRLSRQIDDVSGNTIELITSLSAETANEIEELKQSTSGYSESKFSELSAYTKSNIEYLDDKINGLSGSTNAGFYEIRNEFGTLIEESDERLQESIESLSGNVEDSISEIETKLNTVSADTDSKISVAVDHVIELVSAGIDEVSDRIYDLSAKTESDIDNVSTKIEELSASTNSIFDEANSRIYSISGEVSNLSCEIDGYDAMLLEVERVWAGAFAGMRYATGVDEEAKYNPTLDSLSGMNMTEAIDYVGSCVENVENQIGSVERYVDNAVDGVDEKLIELSESVSEFSANTESEIGELGGLIENIGSDVVSVSGSVDALAEYVVESISGVTDEFNDKISSAKNDAVSLSNQYTNEQIETLSGETVANFNAALLQTKELLEDEISSASTVAKEEAITESASYVDSKIENISGITESYIEEKVEEAKQQAINASEYMIGVSAQTIEESAVNRSAEYTDRVSDVLSGRLERLSGQTISCFSDVSDEIDEINEKIDDLNLNDLQDVDITDTSDDGNLQFLTKSGDTWSNTSIGVASKNKYGFVKLGNGIDVENGVISTQKIDVDSTIERGSENPVSGGAVYPLTEQIASLSATSIEMRSELAEYASEFNEFSATTEEKLTEISGSVRPLSEEVSSLSASSSEMRSEIDEHLLEFDEFSATTEEKMTELSGSVVTDFLEIEKVHAGAFGRINHSLGFSNNAEYIPSQDTNIAGMTVTEAIDYIYQWAENIEHYIDKEDTKQLIRSVTYESLLNLKQNKKLRCGVLYRITNYQATVDESMYNIARPRVEIVQSGPKTSMGFDIIVRATSNQTLDENVVLTMSENKYYFEDCDIESWDVKYCLENDKTRFNWASENGFGVIYYMKDNYGNEAPYDFKNIVYYVGSGVKFTFNKSSDSSDLSLVGLARCNKICPSYDDSVINKAVQILNRNIFDGLNVIGNTMSSGLSNANFNGDFVGCQISSSVSNSTINGPMENEFIGYSTIENLQNQIDEVSSGLTQTELILSSTMEFVGASVDIVATATCSKDALMSIRQSGGAPESSQSEVRTFSRTFTGVNSNRTFIASYNVGGIEMPEKSASITFVNPLYYGAAETYEDLANVSHRASKRTSLSGTYNITVSGTPTYIWFIIPQTMGYINTAKSGGFDFSLNAPISQQIYGVDYYIYRTPQMQEVGSYSVSLT